MPASCKGNTIGDASGPMQAKFGSTSPEQESKNNNKKSNNHSIALTVLTSRYDDAHAETFK